MITGTGISRSSPGDTQDNPKRTNEVQNSHQLIVQWQVSSFCRNSASEYQAVHLKNASTRDKRLLHNNSAWRNVATASWPQKTGEKQKIRLCLRYIARVRRVFADAPSHSRWNTLCNGLQIVVRFPTIFHVCDACQVAFSIQADSVPYRLRPYLAFVDSITIEPETGRRGTRSG